MRLRYRLSLFVGLTLVGLIVGIYLLSSRLLLRSYANMERQDTSRNVQRAEMAFEQLLDSLHSRSTDWAAWDDTYRFMQDHNQAYIQSNLVDASLVSMQLEAVMYVDTQGRIFYAKTAHRLKEVPPPVPADLLRTLALDRPAAEQPKQGKDFSGILLSPSHPLLVSVRPILTSENKGPARGWLVFARYFDEAEMQKLAERTRLGARAYALNDPSLPADARRILPRLTGINTIRVTPLNEETVAGYTLLRDVHKNPAQLLRITEPRHVYKQGVQSVQYLMRLIVLAGLVFGLVIVLALESSVLGRLLNLRTQVERIGDEQEPLTRVELSGSDELTELADKINAMLAAQEKSAQRLRESEEKLRAYNENLEHAVAERIQELETKEQTLRKMNAILENAVEGIAQLDAEGCYLTANLAYASLFGCQPEEMIGTDWLAFISPEDSRRMKSAYQQMQKSGRVEAEAQGVRKDGSFFYNHLLMIAVHDEEGRFDGHYCFLKDISQRKAMEAQIAYQAYHDALTGLPNRNLFSDRVALALARAQRQHEKIAVLFLDLDNFKFVNDTMGHRAGDQLLVTVAERLKACLRPGDTVARLGGDEFILLLEDFATEESVAVVAERVINHLREPIPLETREVFVTTSIGIAFSAPDCQPETLLRNADTAMYQAKNNGKAGFALFEDRMNDQLAERMELESSLQNAVANGELRTYYQPIVNMETGEICGAEALVRWEHPQKGLISPGKFIPLAEETGLIVPIGAWTLEDACRQAKAWHEQYPERPPLIMSVNLSVRQIQQATFVETVADILEKTGLAPDYLKLEVTESVMIEDVEATIQKLEAVKALGVHLALDDFGTGYSSLSYLRRLPVDTVKIDQSFVKSMGKDVEPAAVILSVIRLCRALGKTVTCEGIETSEQVAQLQALGCDLGQGYYFAKPMIPLTFAELLKMGHIVPLAFDDEEEVEWTPEQYIYLAA